MRGTGIVFMIQFLTTVAALSITAGIYLFSGISGLIVSFGMTVLFEVLHWIIYGKSMASIDLDSLD